MDEFTLKEIELLEKCLSSYFYSVGGVPSDVVSCEKKLLNLKEKLEHGHMTRAEKFEEMFGLKVDTDMDCGFFDCPDGRCDGCPFHARTPSDRRKSVKDWWNEEIG